MATTWASATAWRSSSSASPTRYPELPWIRVMYAYPRHVTERFLQVMRERPAVVPYIDMPLQHTHPWTLARMRRPHRDTDELVGWMRDRVPDLMLRTTFIVGFPGETDAEFDALLDSVEPSALRPRRRVHLLGRGRHCRVRDARARAAARQAAARRALDGLRAGRNRSSTTGPGRPELDVLVEGRPEDGSECFAGRSYRDAPEVDGLVLVKAAELPVGELVQVRVERALAYDLLARPV